MTGMRIHPSEFAYAFSYSRTTEVIGWGSAPFRPEADPSVDPGGWYAEGADRLVRAGRAQKDESGALDFSKTMTDIVLTLAAPSYVLLADRKADGGLRRQTVHVAGEVVVGLVHLPDGMFEVTRYADLMAAVAACAGFLGVALQPDEAGRRMETTQDALTAIRSQLAEGATEKAAAALEALGASESEAASLVAAMAAPATAGLLSILYCADDRAVSAEPYSVMTNAQGETWIIFAPGAVEGPMIVEQSSVPALTARLVISIAARLKLAA